jgi:hypothetical protein
MFVHVSAEEVRVPQSTICAEIGYLVAHRLAKIWQELKCKCEEKLAKIWATDQMNHDSGHHSPQDFTNRI